MSSNNEGGPYYHGTAHDFQPGDLVDPSYELGGRPGRSYAFVTTNPGVAHDYAKHKAWALGMFDDTVQPHAYEVRPTGPVEIDDTVDGKFSAWRTRYPLEIVREMWCSTAGCVNPAHAQAGRCPGANDCPQCQCCTAEVCEKKTWQAPGVPQHIAALNAAQGLACPCERQG